MPRQQRKRHSQGESSPTFEMARSLNSLEGANTRSPEQQRQPSPSFGVSAESADSPPSPAAQFGETPPFLGATSTGRFLLGSSVAGGRTAAGSGVGGRLDTPFDGVGVSLSPPDMAQSSTYLSRSGTNASAVAAFLRDFKESSATQGTDDDESTFKDNTSILSPQGLATATAAQQQQPFVVGGGSVDSATIDGSSSSAQRRESSIGNGEVHATRSRLPPTNSLLAASPPSPLTGAGTNTTGGTLRHSPSSLQHPNSAFKVVVSPNSMSTAPTGTPVAPVLSSSVPLLSTTARPPTAAIPPTSFAPIVSPQPSKRHQDPNQQLNEDEQPAFPTLRSELLPPINPPDAQHRGRSALQTGVSLSAHQRSNSAGTFPISTTTPNSHRTASPTSRRYVSSGASRNVLGNGNKPYGIARNASFGGQESFSNDNNNNTPHHTRWDSAPLVVPNDSSAKSPTTARSNATFRGSEFHQLGAFSGSPRFGRADPMPAYHSYLNNRVEAKRQFDFGIQFSPKTTSCFGDGGRSTISANAAGDLEVGGRLKHRHNSTDDLIKMTDPSAWRATSPTSPAARRGQFHGAVTPGGWSDTSLSPHRGSNNAPSGSPALSSGGGEGSGAAINIGGGNDERKKQQERRKRMAEIDEDEMLEKQRRNAVVTSALHNIPWLQRTVEPHSTFGGDKCAVCIAPRFWVRIDWTLRATFLAVLPATVLSLDPSTTTYFALPSTVASFAYWISAPTFGGGLREFVIVLKGSVVTLIFLSIVLALDPTSSRWLFIALYFLQILLIALVAESIKKTGAWCIAVFMVQLYSTPEITNYAFVRDFLVSVIIGGSMGIGAFLFPRINWSHKLATGLCSTYGSALSIIIQGVVSSYWSKTETEREYCLIRIKQLMQVCSQCSADLDTRIDETDYEPHSGETIAKIRRRATFLRDMTRIVACILQLVENIAAKPEILASRLLAPFGDRIQEPLTVLVSAMDNTVLKICDFKHPITETELELFRSVREDFQESLSEIRDELILSNEAYQTEEADVFLGSFLFCIDELGETIATFREPINVPSRVLEWLYSPLDDLLSCYKTLQVMITVLLTEGALIRRAKEAIKLALSMTIPMLIQVFVLSQDDATPVAGPAIIAFVVQRTGAESFQYASNRVLGTVMGSLTALFAVQLADGELWQLYVYLGLLSLVGNFVQTSIPFAQAGNAMVFSVISIISQYADKNAAMNRIQQNIFSITVYFAITYIIWPIRSIEKLKLELDSAIRSYRETMYKLLGNLDAPLSDISDVINAAEEHWNENARRVRREESLVPAAVREPTMIGVAFPEQPWLRLIQSQKTLSSLAWMLRFAFQTFEQSTSVSPGDRSLHWVVVKHIAPQARELSELIFAACDLYLLALSNAEMVPVQHLVRLRTHMMDVYKTMIARYTEALILRLENEDGWQGGDHSSNDGEGGADPKAAASAVLGGDASRQKSTMNELQSTTRGASTTTVNMKQTVPSPKLKPQASLAGAAQSRLAEATSAASSKPPVPATALACPATGLSDLSLSANMSTSLEPMRQTMKPAPAAKKPPLPATPSLEFPASPKQLQSPPPPPPGLPSEMHRPSPVRLGSPSLPDFSPVPPSSASLSKARRDAASPVLSGTILDEVNFSITAANAGIDGGKGRGSASSIAANYVLRNRDIHSLEAFLFGVRASVMEIAEFQKALLEVQHAADLTKKL
jgi:hypothetical protein